MVNISHVGLSVNAPADENNRRDARLNKGGTAPSRTTDVEPLKSPQFVDRRRNPDRRVKDETPLVDTRKQRDRRRTGRLHIEI